jgi:enolase
VIVESLAALEILDSRGRPTIKASLRLAGGAAGSASVPSGASTGSAEARELRDGDLRRHAGLGCRAAVEAVEGEIARELGGRSFPSQAGLDAALCALDGTPSKERLGANAILAVSLAFGRAVARSREIPFYTYVSELTGAVPAVPQPLVNLFSGGAHAGGQVGVQDVQLLVRGPETLSEILDTIATVYRAAVELTRERFDMRLLRADEGGLAPPFETSEQMFAAAVESVERAGLRPGNDVALAVDVAASQLATDGGYLLDGERVDLVERSARWITEFPIVSLEDPLGEDDWAGWTALAARLEGVMLIGDDLLCTRVDRIRRAQQLACADALLLKPNQVGTLSESLEALAAARSCGWAIIVSARSGETEDNWLADIAVGCAAEHIKIGSITQSERLAKYNRLLEIERELV